MTNRVVIPRGLGMTDAKKERLERELIQRVERKLLSAAKFNNLEITDIDLGRKTASAKVINSDVYDEIIVLTREQYRYTSNLNQKVSVIAYGLGFDGKSTPLKTR